MSTEITEVEFEHINRLKIVFADNNRKWKWLAEQLCKNYTIVFRWCANNS